MDAMNGKVKGGGRRVPAVSKPRQQPPMIKTKERPASKDRVHKGRTRS